MCFTGELPWNDNKPDISCIPVGIYQCKVVESEKFGVVYSIQEVPGRTDILIHAGNFAGVKTKGYKSDIEGCILLGRAIGDISGQKALKNSKETLKTFMLDRQGQDFELTII